MTIVRLANGAIQRLVVDVVQARLVMAARVRRGVRRAPAAPKEVVHLPAVGDAGERAVVPAETDAGVQHHRHQEAGLALGEAVQPRPAPTRSSQVIRGSPRRRADRTARPRPLAPDRPPTRRRRSAESREARLRPCRRRGRRGNGRRDLDVLDVAAAVRPLVLDADVRELHAVVDDRAGRAPRPTPESRRASRSGRPSLSDRSRLRSCRNRWYSRLSS